MVVGPEEFEESSMGGDEGCRLIAQIKYKRPNTVPIINQKKIFLSKDFMPLVFHIFHLQIKGNIFMGPGVRPDHLQIIYFFTSDPDSFIHNRGRHF